MKTPCTIIFRALLTAMALAAWSSQAEVYRWVDKDGKVQYSDKPPPEGASKSGAKVVNATPSISPAAKALLVDKETLVDKEIEFKKRRVVAGQKQEQEEKAAKEAEKAAEERKVQCTKQRWRLKDLQEVRSIYDRDEKGEKVYLDDKEREAEIAQTRKNVAKLCE